MGDVHTEANALSDLLDLYGRLGLGAVLCCGDLLDGNGDPLRCIELLQDHGCYVVRGNHERWALAGLMRGWDSPDCLTVSAGRWRGQHPAGAGRERLTCLPLCVNGQRPFRWSSSSPRLWDRSSWPTG